MSQKQIKVRLFGAFRKYSENGAMLLDISPGSSALDFKKKLAQALLHQFQEPHREMQMAGQIESLIEDSAVATSRGVLQNHECVDGLTEIAILPPVCGG